MRNTFTSFGSELEIVHILEGGEESLEFRLAETNVIKGGPYDMEIPDEKEQEFRKYLEQLYKIKSQGTNYDGDYEKRYDELLLKIFKLARRA